MRLSRGHQEMKISYFGYLRDIDYLSHTMECVTHLQPSMVMVFW